MKDKPIIMSAESVRPIFEGRKTQTRRMVSNLDNFGLELTSVKNVSSNPNIAPLFEFSAESITNEQLTDGAMTQIDIRSPYQIGQRLWVREGYCLRDDGTVYSYRADYPKPNAFWKDGGKDYGLNEDYTWKSPIFMPRWASRITLEVTNIRCERVQDITEEDAVSEGITDGGCLTCGCPEPCGCDNPQPDRRDSYTSLWDTLNAKRGYPWDSNPWVWVIEFKEAKT